MPTLTKQTLFGFGIQALDGPAWVADVDNWLPLVGQGENLNLSRNTIRIRQLSRESALSWHYDPFSGWSGSVTVPIIPGAPYITELLRWIGTDMSDATHRGVFAQGRYATVLVISGPLGGPTVSEGATRHKYFADCKVAASHWRVPARGLVTVTLDLRAKLQPTDPPTYTWPAVVPVGLPYMYREGAITRDAIVEDIEFESLEWTTDNKVESLVDGVRLDGGEWPLVLHNHGWPECSGSFVRNARDREMLDIYLAGTYVALGALFTRGANTLNCHFDHVKLMPGSAQPTGGSGRGRKRDRFEFSCEPELAVPLVGPEAFAITAT